MIKAIIFDFFGVLVTEGVTSFNQDFFAGDKEKLKQVDKLVDALNMAVLSYNDFIKKVAALAAVDEEEVRKYIDVNHPNKPLLECIKQELKPRFKIGIISNSGGDFVSEMLGEENAKLFDDIVLSHQVGVAKPEPAIYEIALENLAIRASESVFIDDIERYCEAARGLGMKVIVYKDFSRMKNELEKILASSND